MLTETTVDILNNLSKLFENDNICVCASKSTKAGLIAGFCTLIGGLAGGHIGVAVGGLAGTAVNSYLTSKFVPLAHVIKNQLTDEQKSHLANLVTGLLHLAPGTVAISGLLADDSIKNAVIAAALGYMQTQGFSRALNNNGGSKN